MKEKFKKIKPIFGNILKIYHFFSEVLFEEFIYPSIISSVFVDFFKRKSGTIRRNASMHELIAYEI